MRITDAAQPAWLALPAEAGRSVRAVRPHQVLELQALALLGSTGPDSLVVVKEAA